MSRPARTDTANHERIAILGVPVSAIDMGLAVATILGWAKRREARYVCVCDVYNVTRAQEDPDHLAALVGADMVTPDGKPLSWVGRLRGNRRIRQVCGPELMPAVCAQSIRDGVSHYFYGGAPGVAENLARGLQTRFPGLQVAGTECPPFRALSEAEKDAVVARIESSGAGIVWVGLGCPKQELWIAEHVERIPGAVLIGVGAAFDFHTGRVKRAPRWMRDAGLEWAFRLASEPRRLWRRYLVYAPRFVFLALRESFGGGLARGDGQKRDAAA
ncbi:MAG: WecB/TagA/CpsF family glycosyltransferase [Rhizobiales bacterium]|nr:WecB/TagA/CpsF family glycosyltransferase [Hyphomicrobiales bacterium]